MNNIFFNGSKTINLYIGLNSANIIKIKIKEYVKLYEETL